MIVNYVDAKLAKTQYRAIVKTLKCVRSLLSRLPFFGFIGFPSDTITTHPTMTKVKIVCVLHHLCGVTCPNSP